MNLLYLDDNIKKMGELYDEGTKVDLVYADCIYESEDFSWLYYAVELLKENGIFMVQTDYHTVAKYKAILDKYPNGNYMCFVNWIVWKNEWGNHPKDRFHQCYDDILIYCKGDNWKFNSEKIQVPKTTALTKLNPSGRLTKTATAWIDDICLTTTSIERIKKKDGHLIKWQKPKKLLYRLFSPFISEGGWILDPFLGSGTSAEVAVDLNCNLIGIENDVEVFKLARERLMNYEKI